MGYAAVDSFHRFSALPSSILIIDDDDEVAGALIDLLEGEGHEVSRYSDAGEALEQLAHGAVPDLILLDLMMPTMDGWEFRARQLSDARMAGVPVLVLSGDSSGKARAIDAAGYLRKPLDYRALLDTVSNVLQVHRKQRDEALSFEHDRLSSLGALSASIAHEINNPLQFVLGNLELARRRLGPENDAKPSLHASSPQQVDRLLAQAQRGATRIADVVRSMAAFSRPDTGEHQAIDLHEVLDSSILLLGNELRHRATLERDYQPIPKVSGNPARLGQAFLNLMVNALHAVGDQAPHLHVIRVSTETGARGEAVISISDTGNGMTPRMAVGIFDLFYAARNLNASHARGLTISQRIVREAGGTISVESAPNRGAVFRVVLPAYEAQSLAEAQAPATQSMVVPARPRIMVVDDEPLVCDLVKALLEDAYLVETFTSSREALTRLLSGEESYDLVLCDLMMPELAGMDIHEELKRVAPQLAARMVFMTGGTFTERSHRFLEEMGGATLTKPFRGEQLHDLLEQRLGALKKAAKA